MRKRTKGFILLMTLSLISIMSLLVLAGIQQAFFFHKAILMQEEQYQEFYELEALILNLAAKSSFSRSCIESGNSPNQVIQRLKQNDACIIKKENKKYLYLIEDLGTFPCLTINNFEKKFSSHHLRISLLFSGDGFNIPDRILQIRVIRKETFLSCQDKEHWVNAGVSSWRYLSNGSI